MFSSHLSLGFCACHAMMDRIQMRWGTDGALSLFACASLRCDCVRVTFTGSRAFCCQHTSTLLPAVTAASKHGEEVLLCLCATRPSLWMGNHGDELWPVREFWADQGACGSMSAALWSLLFVFITRSFVFLTSNRSTYLPDVLLSALMLFFHIASQLSETVEWQGTCFFILARKMFSWLVQLCGSGLHKRPW